MPHTKVLHFCPATWLVKLTTDTRFLQQAPLCCARLWAYTKRHRILFSLSLSLPYTVWEHASTENTQKTELEFHQPLKMAVSLDVTLSVPNSQNDCSAVLRSTSSTLRWKTAETRKRVICSWPTVCSLFQEFQRFWESWLLLSVGSLQDCLNASAAVSSWHPYSYVPCADKQTAVCSWLLPAVHAVRKKAWRISLP